MESHPCGSDPPGWGMARVWPRIVVRPPYGDLSIAGLTTSSTLADTDINISVTEWDWACTLFVSFE